jgi:ATP-binding cassette subfamily B protein
MAGDMSPGDLLIFLAYLRRAFNPVEDFAKYTGRLAKAAAAGERVLDLLDRQPEVRNLPDARPAPRFEGCVAIENVRFAYTQIPIVTNIDDTAARESREGNVVLNELTMEIAAGSRVAIVGPSGAGKTTIAGLLLRLYDPLSGCVTIDGGDLRDYTLESLRGQIGTVLQDALLFAASVRENIGYGLDGASTGQIEEAARLANAHEFITALPEGYDTVLGERGVTLSGGQRQRIAIARAAIRNAPILLLDEPTTGLDEQNKRQVLEALDSVGRGRTTILITHDLLLASKSDVIYFLDGGLVAESGSHEELLALDGRYAAMYRLQSLSRQAESVATGV